MGTILYTLCMLTAALCAWLLLRSYSRTRYRLLLWGGLCFGGLTLNNALLVVDKVFLPQVNLFTPRLVVALISMMIMLYGVIWDAE
jgi:uncharacterized protein DUF5985